MARTARIAVGDGDTLTINGTRIVVRLRTERPGRNRAVLVISGAPRVKWVRARAIDRAVPPSA